MADSLDKHLRKEVHMGLGEAVLRLVHVEAMKATGLGASADLIAERDMIVAALNQYDLDLGFDCNAEEGVPEDVTIFERSAQTSCCRILPVGGDSSRKSNLGSGRKQPSSRKRRG